ncbi:hypothetical protein HPB47_001370 [Ixodes persulcatus]|uniref:Uncharacterized protein n=1 Tax=Ixodes persulcatus TaxID=34615 RepID=A0AC60PQR5_IXOPE|nr:hypothetical protein HPB47_001370 [Ixodes persulcatus]
MFIEGKVDTGDYFDNLLSWYEHRNDPNVLFLTYEDLKKDTTAWVLKIADFLGEEYGKKLRANPEALDEVIEQTNMVSMRKYVNKGLEAFLVEVKAIPEEKRPRWVKLMMESVGEEGLKKPMISNFVRKGVVGDWRGHFSAEQDHVSDQDESTSSVLEYLERTYTGVPFGRNRTRRDPPFSLLLWSYYERVVDELPKTNNSAEEWHRSVHPALGFQHRVPYRPIEALKIEQSLTQQKIVDGQRRCIRSGSKPYARIPQKLRNVLSQCDTQPLIDRLLCCRFSYSMSDIRKTRQHVK